MTAKRVTIGAKPMLVSREAETGAGEPERVSVSAEPGPASASTSSIEGWLRQGGTVPDEQVPTPVSAEEPAPIAEPVPHVHHAYGSAPAAEETSAAAAAPARKSGELPPWAGIVGGAIAGAAVAALVAVALPRINPMTDARLGPLGERVTRVENDLRTAGERIGKLNNEMARSLDEQGAATTRIDEQATELGALKQAVTDQAEPVDPASGIDSPVFSVALGQLRTTFYTGRPFEAELMNVYALAGSNDLFAGYLTELMGPARTGVPNAAELYRVFPSYVAASGLRIGVPAGYYQYGVSLVNRYVVATESYKLEAGNLAVTRADKLLAAGNVGGAVEALRDLDAQYSSALAPWLTAANSYLRNENAITEMTRIVVDRLREKIAKDVPAADPTAAEGPAGEPATLPSAQTPDAGRNAAPVDALPQPEASVDLTPPEVPSALPPADAFPAKP